MSTAADLGHGAVTAPGRPAGVPRPAAPRTVLRLVPQYRTTAARAPFVVLVVGLLVAGLLGLLVLNTVLAQDSFRLHALQAQAKDLTMREQALQRSVDGMQAPAELARRAEEQGMVPGGPPVFLHLPDGAVLGAASPGASEPGKKAGTAEDETGAADASPPSDTPGTGKAGTSKAKGTGTGTSGTTKTTSTDQSGTDQSENTGTSKAKSTGTSKTKTTGTSKTKTTSTTGTSTSTGTTGGTGSADTTSD